MMHTLVLICNRLSKLLGNITKILLSYPFHFLFPSKRFSIPKHKKAIFKGKHQAIPKTIWQTNYTNQVSLPIYLNYLFNRLMTLDYDYHYVSTQDRLEFIQKNATLDVIQAYERLNDGAAQADLWRLLVLNHCGGIYMDIDAHLVFPLSKIISKNDKELFITKSKAAHENYTNYFIASDKNHPVLASAVEIIINNINSNQEVGVFSLTGPVPFTSATLQYNGPINSQSYRYVCVQGSFTNEHFQYIDKPNGKWTHKKHSEILKPKQL